MQCRISGEVPKEPVVTKSGHVYEKALLETYVRETGNEPVTGEAISLEDDVIVLEKGNGGGTVIYPKQPALTSIPSLLSSLQTEWDSLILETFSLRQQLLKTRQELSSALYVNDAAVRVAARLTKERDEARSELAKLSASLGVNGVRGGDMEVDEQENGGEADEVSLSSDVVGRISDKSQQLAKIRKAAAKKELPEDYSSVQDIEQYTESFKSKQLFASVSHLDVNNDNDLVITGGGKSLGGVFSIDKKSILGSNFHSKGIINDVRWINNESFIVCTKAGSIDVFNDINDTKSSKSINVSKNPLLNAVISPVGSIVITADNKGNWYIVDIEAETVLLSLKNEHSITSLAIHPDGELVAIGSADGNIRIHKITDENFHAPAATFNTLEGENGGENGGENDGGHDDASVSSLSFSENGYWLAASSNHLPGKVQIWNLKKLSLITSIEFKSQGIISAVKFDHSGQYLAAASSTGIEIAGYNKPEKSWISSILSIPIAGAVDLGWSNKAKSIVSVTSKGNIYIFEKKLV